MIESTVGSRGFDLDKLTAPSVGNRLIANGTGVCGMLMAVRVMNTQKRRFEYR